MNPFSHVYLVTTKLDRREPESVRKAEALIKGSFPAGYLEYVTYLGTGMFCEYIYVYPPERVVEDLEMNREVLTDSYEFWSESHDVLPQKDFGELVVFGHTIDLDKLAFHPKGNGEIWFLPYNSESFYNAGTDLFVSLNSIYESGVPDGKDFRWFDSSIDQAYLKMVGVETSELSKKFAQFLTDLKLSVIASDFNERTWFFARDLNGYMILHSKPDEQNFQITIVYEKDKTTLIANIQSFFLERGFSVTGHGEKKK